MILKEWKHLTFKCYLFEKHIAIFPTIFVDWQFYEIGCYWIEFNWLWLMVGIRIRTKRRRA